MSGSTYLIINHEFNIIDPFTKNGFDYAYVGTAYDNVVDHYRLAADTSFVTPNHLAGALAANAAKKNRRRSIVREYDRD